MAKKRRFTKLLDVWLDEFTFSSLVDLAEEQYEGCLSRAGRDIIKKALAEWDDRNARILGENC